MTIGCLFVHGFGGAPYELKPLYEEINQSTDWILKFPILPGHSEQESLEGRQFEEWIQKAEENLQELSNTCETINLIGYSMGGMIAAYLSTKYKVDKLILLSTSAHYIDTGQIAKDLWKMIKDGMQGDLTENDMFQRYIQRLGSAPMSASIQFQKLVNELRPCFQKVYVPSLIVQGGEDGLLPPKSAEFIYESIPAADKTLHFLPQSKHMVCYGPEQDDLINLCCEFLDMDKRIEL